MVAQFREPVAPADAPGTEATDREVPLAVLQGRRLRALKTQWADLATLARYLVLVVALDPCTDFLCQIYRWEAHVYPDLRAHAARLGHRAVATEPPSGKLVTGLASGTVVGTILSRGSSVLAEEAACASHVQLVRELVVGALGPDLAWEHWRKAVLPGLAQLWYRTLWVYTRTWPWLLLQLLPSVEPDEGERRAVAEEFWQVCPQCLDRGLSLPLRADLLNRYAGLCRQGLVEMVVSLADGAFCAILEQLRSDLEVSVVDVERPP